MALYTIGDTHLSLGTSKPMDVFGGNWENYVEKLSESLGQLNPEDTLVLCGDISWGMSLPEALPDFRFLDSLPGTKYILKGNHDYWWTTAAKFRRFCEEKGLRSLDLLHNNCAFYGDYALCGTRGWFLEEEQKPHNAKVLAREIGRLETSLQAAGEKPILCFLHYPPIYQGYQCPEILTVLAKYHVEQCCYGHLHGPTIRRRLEGKRGETEFSLISADYLGFVPKKICE